MEATHGRSEDLPKRLGLGSTTVHRILNEGVIKPHKVDHWCGKSPDPEFEEKQATIIRIVHGSSGKRPGLNSR